ncbi:MAG: hypothetical protein HW380_834 [Magnetococcales bacterium]|nr:hypothetical protein [Magnetococcales bacterium]
MTVQEAVWVLSILGGILFLGAGFFLSSFFFIHRQRILPPTTADSKDDLAECLDQTIREDDKHLTVIHGYLSDILWMVEKELHVQKDLDPATASMKSAIERQTEAIEKVPEHRRFLIHEIKNSIADLQSGLSLIFELRRQKQFIESIQAKDAISFLGDRTFKDQCSTLTHSLTQLLAYSETPKKIDYPAYSKADLADGLDQILGYFVNNSNRSVKKAVVLDSEGFSLSGSGATEEELKQLALSAAMLIADSVRGQKMLYSEELKFYCYQDMKNTVLTIYRLPLSLREIFLAIQVQDSA